MLPLAEENQTRIMTSTLQKRWSLISALILVVSAAWMLFTTTLAHPTTNGSIPAPQVGFQAPDFSLADDAGNTYKLSELAGRPVIVNFWASWCRPCRAEMPALQAAADQHRADGLAVLAVNATQQDNPAAARQFLDSLEIQLPLLLDDRGDVNRQYQVRALPTTFFISADGKIQELIVGGPLQPALIEARILGLLEAP